LTQDSFPSSSSSPPKWATLLAFHSNISCTI
jgi:hypothetical protein